MPHSLVSQIREHYRPDFLEKIYTHIKFAHVFMTHTESCMNVCDAPVDELYDRIENIYAELDELYSVLCEATDRVRVDKKGSINATD